MTIRESIVYYAGFKMSMRAISQTIGVKYSAVRGIVQEENLSHLFDPKGYIRDCKGGRSKGQKIRPHYRDGAGRVWLPGEPTYMFHMAQRGKG